MGLNTAASISFSQINSTSYFTNGNLGINTTNPTANLDVAGTIKASGLSSLASITTGDLSATNVSAGVINSTGLTTGNINFTGSLFQNGVAYVGSQWTSTSGNVSYTSGSVVATNLLATNVTYSNLVTPNVNLGVSSIFSGSFSASNNVVAPTDVTDFVFANANIRSFTANVSVSVVLSVGTSLYSIVTLYGNQNSNGWSLYTDTKGDNTGITFTITNTGQIQYTSTNQSNWTSTIFRYNAQQLSATGTYTSVLVNTQGSYIMSTVQLNDTTDAVAGVSNGPLYVLGGGTITKSLNVNGVVSTGGLSVTNATATNVSTGTINATGTSVLASAQISNADITTTSIGTARITSALLALGNSNTIGSIFTTGGNVGINTATPGSALHVAGSMPVSPVGAGVHMGIDLNTYASIQLNSTIGSYIDFAAGGIDYNTRIISMSNGNLNISNIPDTCNVGINNASPSANLDVVGTVKVSGLSALANVTATNVSTGTLIATTSVTSGLLSATNIVGNSISAGTLSATTISGANLSLSGNLSVAGTLTTVNITSTNMLNTNISAGTINATGLSSLQNVTLTNVSAGTLSASTGITAASLRVTNENVTTSTIATLRVSSNLLALGNSNTIGNIFTTGGNVGINTTNPGYTLDIVGTSKLNGGTGGTTSSLLFSGIDDGGNNRLVFAHTSSASQYQKIALQTRSPGSGGGRANFHVQVNTANDATNASISDTRLFIDGFNGGVGIGTTSPGYTLDVAGSLRTTGLSALANATITGSAGVGTNGALLISGGDSFGHSLYIASASALGKRMGFQRTVNEGAIFAYDYPGGVPQNLILQGPGGNVGIGTASPTATLHVAGTARIGGNVGFKVWTISGTHSASGTSSLTALPAGCTRSSIISVTGVTYNNTDVIPFNGLGAEWVVAYYVATDSNSVYLAPGSTAANKPFIVTIMTNT